MQSGLELARRPQAMLAPRREAEVKVAMALGWFGLVAMPFVLAALPLSVTLWLAGGSVACAVIAAIPRRGAPWVHPEDIADPVMRRTYDAILSARRELELALASAPGFHGVASSLNERCDEAVRMCARVAPAANRLHAYLATHDSWDLAREAAQLRVRSASTPDEATARNLAQAAEACEAQVASCDDLARTRDRIQARLDNVLASLRAFTAAVVKQQTAEDEQLALAGESISEHVDGVRQELGILESATILGADPE